MFQPMRILALALMTASSASVAQSPETSAAQPRQSADVPGRDANQVICQTQEVTGSRLGRKRVCKTRAEWADFQLQERQQLEKAQVQRGNSGGN